MGTGITRRVTLLTFERDIGARRIRSGKEMPPAKVYKITRITLSIIIANYINSYSGIKYVMIIILF